MRTRSFSSPVVRRATLAIASVAVIGTVAAGCGSSSKGGSAGPLTSTSTAATTTAPPSTTPSDATSSDTTTDGPSTDDSGTDDTRKVTDFKRVLLTASEVSNITGEEFTAQPSDDSDDASSEPSGCAAVDDFVAAAKDSEKGKATATFANGDQAQQAEEQLTYVPEKAATLFTQLKDAIGSCDSLGLGQDSLKLAVQDDPEVQGADDTAAFTASATGSGKSIVVTALLARFGDNIVHITYSAVSDQDNPIIGDDELLTKAAGKAESVLT
jgi:hypothetical protein